ncbi:Uncharacterized protein HZ326_18215 [Fusarium oxysporum f. sp. albedinis]|nr:Uncharacterized protein HZ326_18215 [Fusarium oxysporum f. sp. albedinis]
MEAERTQGLRYPQVTFLAIHTYHFGRRFSSAVQVTPLFLRPDFDCIECPMVSSSVGVPVRLRIISTHILGICTLCSLVAVTNIGLAAARMTIGSQAALTVTDTTVPVGLGTCSDPFSRFVRRGTSTDTTQMMKTGNKRWWQVKKCQRHYSRAFSYRRQKIFTHTDRFIVYSG